MGLRPDARKVSELSFVCTRCLTLTIANISSTLVSSSGLKTRHFGTIISELSSCLRIHGECMSRLGGVSLEFTGELNEEGYSVTECLGGSMELSEEELGLRYQVRIDPHRPPSQPDSSLSPTSRSSIIEFLRPPSEFRTIPWSVPFCFPRHLGHQYLLVIGLVAHTFFMSTPPRHWQWQRTINLLSLNHRCCVPRIQSFQEPASGLRLGFPPEGKGNRGRAVL